jgi:hypothetical protein
LLNDVKSLNVRPSVCGGRFTKRAVGKPLVISVIAEVLDTSHRSATPNTDIAPRTAARGAAAKIHNAKIPKGIARIRNQFGGDGKCENWLRQWKQKRKTYFGDLAFGSSLSWFEKRDNFWSI